MASFTNSSWTSVLKAAALRGSFGTRIHLGELARGEGVSKKIRNGLQTLSKGWRGKGPSNEGGAVEDKLQPGVGGQAVFWVVEVAEAEVDNLLPLPLARPLEREDTGPRLPPRLLPRNAPRKELLDLAAGSLLLKAFNRASSDDFTTVGAASWCLRTAAAASTPKA